MYHLLRKCVVLFLVFFVFNLNLLSAVEVKDLYQVEVGVDDQSGETRWSAMANGFREILVRRSGTQDILSTQEAQKATSKVTAYLQRFEYVPVKVNGAPHPYQLVLHFEPRLIDQLIQESGMPIWGTNRPVTLLWLALEEGTNRDVLKESEQMKPQIDALKQQTARRGVPVIFPLMDLDDQLNVSISDVWGRFDAPVIKASERYSADAVIIGRLNRSGDLWQAKLDYINNKNQLRLELAEATLEDLYATLANRLAEALCQKYCVVEQAQTSQLTMQVSNIHQFASYKSLQSYLDGLPSVRRTEVSQIANSSIRLQISLLGDLSSLRKDLELGNKLIEEEAPQQDPFTTINPIAEKDNGADVSNEIKPTPVASDLPISVASNDNTAPVQTTPSNLVDETNSSLPLQDANAVLYYRWQE